MATNFTLPYWYDLHVHVRQGGLIAPLVTAHRSMGCAGILAMPNTRPPVASLAQIGEYKKAIRESGGDFEALIVPLYLTRDTTPGMILEGVRDGVLQACKYYPPHGTTNADFGAALDTYMDNGVFAAMQESGVVLCIHGEEHGLAGAQYFDRKENAEEIFYTQRMPRLVKKFPRLKIVCEHITTKTAVDFVSKASKNIAASVTPQHLLYTIGDLLQGLKYHLYCLPLVKFSQDREALRNAVMKKGQVKFFAGTDSAPHTVKCTPCGCAAGCFTGGIAPQLYAMAFEDAGADLDKADNQKIFAQFLCHNGASFYGLPPSHKTFQLIREHTPVMPLSTPEGIIWPLPAGLNPRHETEGTALPWRLLV